jgi:hypothetical protein
MIATHLRSEGSKGEHHHGEVCTEGQVAEEDELRLWPWPHNVYFSGKSKHWVPTGGSCASTLISRRNLEHFVSVVLAQMSHQLPTWFYVLREAICIISIHQNWIRR